MFQRFEETTKFRNADEAMEAMKYANELMSQAIAYLTNTGASIPSMKASPKPIEISMKNADTTATHLFNGFSNNDNQYSDATKRQNIKVANDQYVMAMRYSFDHLPAGEDARTYDRIVTNRNRVIHSWEGDDCGVFITIDGDTTIIHITADTFNEILKTVINRTESVQSYLRLALNDERKPKEEKDIAEKILAYIDWKSRQ